MFAVLHVYIFVAFCWRGLCQFQTLCCTLRFACSDYIPVLSALSTHVQLLLAGQYDSAYSIWSGFY